MFSTANIIELQALLGASLSDPHHILGMHEVVLDAKTLQERRELIARVFVPGAVKVTIIDPADEKFSCELAHIHKNGLFESTIHSRNKWFRYQLVIETENARWTAYDPYSFMPVISDYDLYLFAQGTHYEVYEKMGAVPMVVDGIDGVLFSVWAPNAKRVSVVGDFNNWDGRRHMMRLLKTGGQSSGVWELFVPGLSRYDRYKYELVNSKDALVMKSDPYGRFHELRPSTNSLVYDIEGYNWGDGDWLSNRKNNSPLNGPVNIYELHMGSWKRTPEGGFMTYRTLADELVPYLKDMNYTHIELMPVTEYPFDGSWGYQVTGYFAPTSRFGNPHDFMYFVDMMHRNNIGVILDWVPAHFPRDAHGLASFDGSALYEHEDARLGEHPDWGTLIFNYGRNEVKNFLLANALFWVEKYHIDGLRVDAVASLLYLSFGKRSGQYMPNRYGGDVNLEAVEFIKHLNSIVLERNPNVLMIAEESTAWKGVSRPLDQNGLGFNLKWNMGWMNDFLAYMAKDPIHRRYHHNNLTFGMMYAHTENFVLVLSHDEVVHLKGALVNKMPGDLWRKCANLRASLTYMYGHPGKKLLFMGGEFGQFSEWSEERSLDWFLLHFDHHRQVQDFTRDLNALYLHEPAFWFDDFSSGGFEWIDCDDSSRSLLAFKRKTDKPADDIYFVINFTPNPVERYRLGLSRAGTYNEILNSDDKKYGGSGVVNGTSLKSIKGKAYGKDNYIEITIPPLGAAVFKKE